MILVAMINDVTDQCFLKFNQYYIIYLMFWNP